MFSLFFFFFFFFFFVNTDKMKFDHVNTVFVSISFRHTFLSSLVLVA